VFSGGKGNLANKSKLRNLSIPIDMEDRQKIIKVFLKTADMFIRGFYRY
jgi:hypothetical protein